MFTLIYAVVVAAKDNEFTPTQVHPAINIYQYVFSNVRIVVLWTFLNIPSIPEFFTVYIATDRDKPESWIGESADQCVQHFMQHAIAAKYEMLVVLPDRLVLNLVTMGDVSTFFKAGLTDTPEYQNYRFCITHRPYYLVRCNTD